MAGARTCRLLTAKSQTLFENNGLNRALVLTLFIAFSLQIQIAKSKCAKLIILKPNNSNPINFPHQRLNCFPFPLYSQTQMKLGRTRRYT